MPNFGLKTHALPVAGGGASAPDGTLGWDIPYLDMTSPDTVYNPNSMTYTVTDASGSGDGYYNLSVTGPGTARDGPEEGVTLIWDPTDLNGNVVDLREGKHIVYCEAEMHSAGSTTTDVLWAFGIAHYDSSAASGSRMNIPRMAGIEQDGSTMRQLFFTADNANNGGGSLASNTRKIRTVYTPNFEGTFNNVMMATHLWQSNANTRVTTEAVFSFSVMTDDFEPKFAVFMGTDDSGTTTEDRDWRVKIAAIRAIPESS